ncbi:MAG: bacteriohopanetetrol glucosamine biosynthesis glycosyltransferase HpnI [Acidobacteriota bacterium]
MPHTLAFSVELVTTVFTLLGMGYLFAAIFAANLFLIERRPAAGSFAPGVSILKSLKGLDPSMLEAFRTHCRQNYAGEYELLFGVASLDDPAAAAVLELQGEFPEQTIRLIECPERLGTNGKVSTLAQLVVHAHYDYLLINDSDITVTPNYLARIMAEFEEQGHRDKETKGRKTVGLVTALYRGRAQNTLGSRLEALGIAVEFQPSVLLSRLLERGMRYGLGSTLAVRRDALEAIGGFPVLADYLADDYELGARVHAAGYAVVLSHEPVETSVPAYNWRAFVDHQVRWFRTVRDARPGGYAGLAVTHAFAWALLNVIASGISPVSLWLLALTFFLRLSVAMTVGVRVLRDHQALSLLWLLPLRDVVAIGLWIAGFAGNAIVWRGERFVVRRGKLTRADTAQS